MKKKSRLVRVTFFFLLFIFLSACASPPAAPAIPQFILITQDPNASPTPTPFQPAGLIVMDTPSSTQVPPTEIPTQTFTPLPASATPATAIISAPPEAASASRTNYILYATLDFTARTLSVDETIRYTNNTGTALSDIVLSVQPNLYGSTFTLNSISFEGAALTTFSLSGHRLGLSLPQPLQPDSVITLNLNFNLNTPAKDDSR